jgi:SAM-dependent methyltransferase
MSATDWKTRIYDSYRSVGGESLPAGATAASLFRPNKAFIENCVRRFFPADKNALILDLACGAGSWVYFARQMGYARARGCDISPEQVALAQRLGIEGVAQGELGEYLEQVAEPCRMVLLIDILEHLEKQELFDLLDQVYRKLEAGGQALIHVPNANGLFGMNIRYGDLTHETAFTAYSMTQLLSAVGFRKIECHEDTPLGNSLKGRARNLIWRGGMLFFRLLFAAETGSTRLILSQNMTVVAVK